MQIKFIDSPLYSVKKLAFPLNDKKLELYLHGEVLGQVDEQGKIVHDHTSAVASLIKSIVEKNQNSSFDLFIGSFSLIILDPANSKLDIYTSTTGTSPYLVKAHSNELTICFDENKLIHNLKNHINTDTLLMISRSHQLISRYPFSLYGISSTFRNPSGHHLSITLNDFKVTILSLIKPDPTEINLEKLKITLSSIISLYYNRYANDIGLLFSGGLDSSCLAAILNSKSYQLPFYHIDYKGATSFRSRVAAYIAEKLGYISLHIPKCSTNLNPELVFRSLSKSFLSLPNSMYLSQPISRKRYNMPKYMITGQGADSLYVIDSFAPSTELIGDSRVKNIIASAPKRLALCEENILRQLKLDNNFNNLSGVIASNSFTSLVDNQCSSEIEHVDYHSFQDKPLTQSYLLRNKFITKPVLRMLRGLDLHAGQSVTSLLRYVKWLRSLTNVPINYANSFESQGIQRLTPFLEAPIVRMFFNYKIRSIEALQIKDLLEALFTNITSLSHRNLVEQALDIADLDIKLCGKKIDAEPDQGKVLSLNKETVNILSDHFKNSNHYSSLRKDIRFVDQLMRICPWL